MTEDAARPLPKRRHRRPRCPACTLHASLCVCSELPRVALPVRWLIVQHAVDVHRPTSTGRLAAAMLAGAEVVPFGMRGQTFDDAPLRDPAVAPLLLFPAGGAAELSPPMLEPDDGRPRMLVLLDGTWRQASRMSHRIAALRAMPTARLPPGLPSTWTIRRPDRPERLCTIETAIRVVALAGRLDDARRMWEAMKWIEARLLFMRGRRPRPPSLDEVRAELAGAPPPWAVG